MIATCKNFQYFAWGKNDKGQLGVGNKETQYSPKRIIFSHQEDQCYFQKIACGLDFSMGLTQEGAVYVWGNKAYLGTLNSKQKEPRLHAEEPMR